MVRTKKIEKERRKPIFVDSAKKLLIVRKNSVIDRTINFEGKIIGGINVSFWGDISCDELYVGKASFIKGVIKCRKAVIGAATQFNQIIAKEEVLILNRCIGNFIRCDKNVLIRKGVVVGNLEAESVLIDGISRIGRINAKKIIASKSEE
jgi:cytoskeletal protein CcmA (bactofilin family)